MIALVARSAFTCALTSSVRASPLRSTICDHCAIGKYLLAVLARHRLAFPFRPLSWSQMYSTPSIGPYLDPLAPCSLCRDERYAFERVFRLGVYDDALRLACLRAKATSAEPLAAGLGELLWECESEAIAPLGIDVVVPVPHHWLRRFYRSHNTAETLAGVWAARLNVPLATHILRKGRWTRSQARLPPYERRRNLRDVFRASPSAGLAGATVLLADDVMTTGTTAHETAKVLVQAGAARVIVAVIARGLGRR